MTAACAARSRAGRSRRVRWCCGICQPLEAIRKRGLVDRLVEHRREEVALDRTRLDASAEGDEEHKAGRGERGLAPDRFGKRHSALLAELLVDECELEGLVRACAGGERCEGTLAVRRGRDRETRGHELTLEDGARNGVVVDDQHARRLEAGRELSGGSGDRAFEIEDEPERAAGAELAREGDASAHELRELLGDGETQPGAAVAARVGGVHLREFGEQAVLQLLWNADARVDDLELDPCPSARGVEEGDQKRNAALLGEFHGVAREVEEDLAQAARVAAQAVRHLGCNVAADLDALRLGARRQQVDDAFDQATQLEVQAVDLELARLHLREVEDVVDDGDQRLARFPRGLGVIELLAVELGVEQEIDHAEHAVHRRADLVAHGGEELGLRLAGELGLLLRGAELDLALLVVRDVDAGLDPPGVLEDGLARLDPAPVLEPEVVRRLGLEAAGEALLDPALLAPDRIGEGAAVGGRARNLLESRTRLEHVGGVGMDLAVARVALDEAILRIEHREALVEGLDRIVEEGARPHRLRLGLDLRREVGTGAAIAEESAFVAEDRHAAHFEVTHDAVAAQTIFEVAERLVLRHRLALALPARLVALHVGHLLVRLAEDLQGIEADLLEVAFGEVGEAPERVGLPQPVGGGGGVVAEALLAVAQARFGELALAQEPVRPADAAEEKEEQERACHRDAGEIEDEPEVGVAQALALVFHQPVGLLQRVHGQRAQRLGELVQAVDEAVDGAAIAFLERRDLGRNDVEPRQEIAHGLLGALDVDELGRVGALVQALQPAQQHVEAQLQVVVAYRRVGDGVFAQRIEEAIEIDLGLGRRPRHVLLGRARDLLLFVEDLVEAEEDAGREQRQRQDQDAVAAQARKDAHRAAALALRRPGSF